ncbi:hypothetical protein LAZ67_13000945 [Cordylochernes scorpioides]|uniref:Uncharacterized protein n=1 Tax=Cordylochernes scorpioides TaxID=51811 RepID=A0ABY6L631_9ARAC|nr:hypothetical protein LAZ67_13000945 [Cordylochernes scorpioides]
MKSVYVYRCLYKNRIFIWVGKFKSGIEGLDDAPRPGAPVKVSDDATTWAIDEKMQNDHNISIIIVSAEHNLSYGSVSKNYYNSNTFKLQNNLHKMGALAPHKGNEGKTSQRLSSAEWHHNGSPTPKKPRITASAGKILLTIFWDSKGCILEYYLPKGQTVNSI